MAGKNYFGLEGKRITLSQLVEYPILMLEKSSTTSEFFQQLFVRHGLSLTPEAELSSNDLLLDLARIGLGITVVPDFVLAPSEEDFYKLDIQEPIPKDSWCWLIIPRFRPPREQKNSSTAFSPRQWKKKFHNTKAP